MMKIFIFEATWFGKLPAMFGPMELGGGLFSKSVGVVELPGNGFVVEFTVATEKDRKMKDSRINIDKNK